MPAGLVGAALPSPLGGTVDPRTLHAWTWVPVANEELVIAEGCTDPPRGCGVVVARPSDDRERFEVLVSASSWRDIGEIARGGDTRHVRLRALDLRGIFSRDISYLYGKVEIGPLKRP
jgi:hypothetical protein